MEVAVTQSKLLEKYYVHATYSSHYKCSDSRARAFCPSNLSFPPTVLLFSLILPQTSWSLRVACHCARTYNLAAPLGSAGAILYLMGQLSPTQDLLAEALQSVAAYVPIPFKMMIICSSRPYLEVAIASYVSVFLPCRQSRPTKTVSSCLYASPPRFCVPPAHTDDRFPRFYLLL